MFRGPRPVKLVMFTLKRRSSTNDSIYSAVRSQSSKEATVEAEEAFFHVVVPQLDRFRFLSPLFTTFSQTVRFSQFSVRSLVLV